MSVVAIDCKLVLVQPIDDALTSMHLITGKVQEVLTIELYQDVELSANENT